MHSSVLTSSKCSRRSQEEQFVITFYLEQQAEPDRWKSSRLGCTSGQVMCFSLVAFSFECCVSLMRAATLLLVACVHLEWGVRTVVPFVTITLPSCRSTLPQVLRMDLHTALGLCY